MRRRDPATPGSRGPFKLAITNETLTPFSGLALFGEFARTIKLRTEVSGVFPIPGARRDTTLGSTFTPAIADAALRPIGGRYVTLTTR